MNRVNFFLALKNFCSIQICQDYKFSMQMNLFSEKDNKDISFESLAQCFAQPYKQETSPSDTSSSRSTRTSENSDSSDEAYRSPCTKDEVIFFFLHFSPIIKFFFS